MGWCRGLHLHCRENQAFIWLAFISKCILYSLINIHYHVLEKTSCFLLSPCFDSLFQSALTLLVFDEFNLLNISTERKPSRRVLQQMCNTQIVKIPLQEHWGSCFYDIFRYSCNFTLKYLQFNFSYCVIFSCCSSKTIWPGLRKGLHLGRNRHFYHINQVTKLHFPFHWSWHSPTPTITPSSYTKVGLLSDFKSVFV